MSSTDRTPGRLLRLPEVLRLVPVSKSTWYRGIRKGIYPAPVKLSSRAVAWWHGDIVTFLEARESNDF